MLGDHIVSHKHGPENKLEACLIRGPESMRDTFHSNHQQQQEKRLWLKKASARKRQATKLMDDGPEAIPGRCTKILPHIRLGDKSELSGKRRSLGLASLWKGR